MKLDSTLTLSVIIALAALIVPSITSIFNNRHIVKMKKLEFKSQDSQHIRRIFEYVLISYGELVKGGKQTTIELAKIRSAILRCLPYVNEKHSQLFMNFFESLYTKNDKGLVPKDELRKLIPVIRFYINNLSPTIGITGFFKKFINKFK